MTPISTMMYEVKYNELLEMPEGIQVLQEDTVNKLCKYEIKTTKRDLFPANRRYKFYLLEAPPLNVRYSNIAPSEAKA